MKKYNKHYLKRNPSDQRVMVEDGKPVLGEVAKSDLPLEDWHIQALNKSWKKTGVFYALIEETKSDARLAMEKEATDLEIKFRDNIGDDKLQEKINKVKKEEE